MDDAAIAVSSSNVKVGPLNIGASSAVSGSFTASKRSALKYCSARLVPSQQIACWVCSRCVLYLRRDGILDVLLPFECTCWTIQILYVDQLQIVDILSLFVDSSFCPQRVFIYDMRAHSDLTQDCPGYHVASFQPTRLQLIWMSC